MNRKEKRKNKKVIEPEQGSNFYDDFNNSNSNNFNNNMNNNFNSNNNFNNNMNNNNFNNNNNNFNNMNNNYNNQNNNNNNNFNNNNMNNNGNMNSNVGGYVYQEKQYKTNTLKENTVVTNASKASRVFLFGFYALFIVVGIAVFFILRADRYEFYLKNEEVSISVGSSYQVELIPKNERYFDYLNYDYKIMDESIATVNEFGKVTAVGNGSTTLKISLSPGFTSKTMKINTESLYVETVGLAADINGNLNKNSIINMEINQTIALRAIINNRDDVNTTVNYTSSDPSIATVDGYGYVTSKSTGTATITGEKNGITGSIVINVKKSSSPSDTQPKVIENIAFSSSSITLKKGSATQLTVVVVPKELSNSAMTWTSSNPEVVGVDNKGMVTAIKDGSAKITVTSSNGKIATCDVKVSDDTVNISSIQLNTNSAKIPAGSVYQLTAKISPDNATVRSVTWSSSNEKIATVNNNGLVTTISEGNVTITVKSSDGKVSSSCNMVVEKKAAVVTPAPSNTVKLTEVSIMPRSTIERVVGEAIQLSINKTPENATVSSIKWSSNDPSVASVDGNGVVKALKKGTAVITVEADGKKATASVLVDEQKTVVQPTATPKATATPSASAPAGKQIPASEVNLSVTSLTINKNGTATFDVKVSNAAGLITVTSSNTGVATVSSSSSDCNGSKCFFDNNSITFTVKGVNNGTANINITLDDVLTYDEKAVTGSGSVGILVK